ncbi:Retrovirus-related Pol polyprotein from transposon TNT 1-94 [Vitis vinifera]|uniref:Retrovirus-related Pol polyprotein from transposon TNT 1-94 n=1 Tax=Vitis vinifera TaxID=29760 RepID=A0A438JAH2_VITVI|nr:Retrovirus-related Pol polyprotein from transposon TNT 1-94 [Vitis vinifera]
MMILLGCMDIDLALRMPKPDELNEQSTQEDEVYWGKWERSNRLSLMIMKRGIPEAFRGAVTDEVTNASDFLAEIQKRFAKNDKAETSTLLASLISMKYKGKGNVREYIMEMSHLASKLKALKLELSDDLLVHLVLISLPAQFNQFKVSYNCQKDKWTLNELISFCVQEEERLKQDKTESAHLASTSKDKGKRKNKDNKVAASNGPEQKKQKVEVTCFFCNKPGHTKKECTKYVAWRVKKGMFLTLGCLSYRKPSDAERCIYVGDGTGLLNVYDNLYLLETVPSYNETLHVESRGTKRKLNKDNLASLWHKRLGHISKSRVERLVSDGILDSLDFSDFDICVECIKGKHTKTKKLGANRATDVLELIQADICGPYPTASWNGQQYFITFIDDYSRYGYLFLIHEKSQSLDVFKTFKAKVELQLNKRIKSVRSDRGGEYYGRYDGSGEQHPGPFAKYLEECGIVPQYTMPGSPSMNGVAERRNRTLKDMARNIVFEEEEGSTIAFDNVQVSLPIIDQEECEVESGMMEDDPINFQQAMKSSNSQKWIEAMNEEYKSMQDNKVGNLSHYQLHIARHQEIFIKTFEMKDLGDASFVLGIQIHRDCSRGILRLSQRIYIDKVLQRYGMQNSKPGDTPVAKGDKFSLNQCPKNSLESQEMQKIPYASAVGSLMYAQVCTRPDIAYIVGMLDRYLSNPGMDHWRAAKRVMRYLQRTKEYMLTYRRLDQLELIGYSDSDFAGCQDNRRSTSGYIYLLAGGAISWRSAKQTLVTSSTMEAEFVACYEASNQGIWLRNFVTGLRVLDGIERPLKIFCDNKSAVLYSNNNRSSTKSKYIDIKFLVVKEKVQSDRYP